MLLRTRISLFVSLAFVVVCLSFVVAALERELLVTSQFSGKVVSDQRVLWDNTVSNLVGRMEEHQAMVSENPQLAVSVKKGDRAAIQHLGTLLASNLKDQGIADRLDILDLEGALLFSSLSSVFQTPIVSPSKVQTMIENGQVVSGIGNDQYHNISVVVAIPLFVFSQVVGLAVYATDIEEAIREMERITQSSVILVNRRGRLISGDAKELWDSLQDSIDIRNINTFQTVKSGSDAYSFVLLDQTADLGNLVTRLLTLKDVTAYTRQHERIVYYTAGALGGFLILVLFALNFYLSRSFAPLTGGVRVLNALSRGDLRVDLERTDRQDEIGRIASAVNVFRTHLIAINRFRSSQKRQRIKQERFIRREMTRLADTLDEEERIAVLEELSELEKLIKNAPDGDREARNEKVMDNPMQGLEHGSSSLAMTALAFRKMSDRVQTQNYSLREALKAKNAFIAIQKELDIATRVQLSLLPHDPPPTERFCISGAMKAAKEVGGDFYDFFRLDEERVVVVIADVSGKGVPAALFTVMARTLMRSTVRQTQSPGEFLGAINEFLEQNNDEQLFITVFYGLLNERTGRFWYANGGHTPPILVDDEGVRMLPLTGGVALGMFGGLEYMDSHIDLKPGSKLVLTTDGVTEAINSKLQEFGDERLLRIIEDLPEQAPSEDVNAIVEAVESFVGKEPQFDDITCMVLQYSQAGFQGKGGWETGGHEG